MNKELALTFYNANYIQRWNDRFRLKTFPEMDLHAHKMMIAYVLAKYEEDQGKKIDWDNLIQGGIFELLRRTTLTDIKSEVHTVLKNKYPQTYRKLLLWAISEIEPKLEDEQLKENLKTYLLDKKFLTDLNHKILHAAHRYATYFEFFFIKKFNPRSYDLKEIEKTILNDLKEDTQLEGVKKILAKHKIIKFLDLCGNLRFQVRWGWTPRLTNNSVLGHSLIVALLAYFFSKENDPCPIRLKNNFFGSLFHDLPEAVTRDIVHPVKYAIPEMQETIEKIEEEFTAKKILPFLKKNWQKDMLYYLNYDHQNWIKKNGKKQTVTLKELNEDYNQDKFNPLDGEIIKFADNFSTFLEVYSTTQTGLMPPHMRGIVKKLKKKFKHKTFGKLNTNRLFRQFR
jgi:putative hydrolase of HD superfamily